MEYNGKIPSSANTFGLICTIYTFIYLPLLIEKIWISSKLGTAFINLSKDDLDLQRN